jgi:hypothetical protein
MSDFQSSLSSIVLSLMMCPSPLADGRHQHDLRARPWPKPYRHSLLGFGRADIFLLGKGRQEAFLEPFHQQVLLRTRILGQEGE